MDPTTPLNQVKPGPSAAVLKLGQPHHARTVDAWPNRRTTPVGLSPVRSRRDPHAAAYSRAGMSSIPWSDLGGYRRRRTYMMIAPAATSHAPSQGQDFLATRSSNDRLAISLKHVTQPRCPKFSTCLLLVTDSFRAEKGFPRIAKNHDERHQHDCETPRHN